MDLVLCPESGSPAVVEWTDVLDSTDGPVEHAKVRCERRHHFLMPADRLPHLPADLLAAADLDLWEQLEGPVR